MRSVSLTVVKVPLEIWKFGGASLADEHGIRRAVDQIAAHRGPLVVVASALAGVTDLLLSATPEAAQTFRARHHAVARAIAKGADRDRLIAAIDASAREYEEICKALKMLGHIEPRARD